VRVPEEDFDIAKVSNMPSPHATQLVKHCQSPNVSPSASLITVCAVPVAKRNFIQRHGHGMISSAMQLRNEVDTHCQPCENSAAMPLGRDFSSVGWLRRDSRTEQSRNHHDVCFDGSNSDRPLDFREKTWLNLLHERPHVNDQKLMANWLNMVRAFSEQEHDTPREAQIQPSPDTAPCIEIYMHQVLQSLESISDVDASVAAMERHNFGCYTQSSTSLEAGFWQTSQESAMVTCEIAEFDDFMDGVDTSVVLV
jgi:hypothetical protein